ncbi:MAG: Synechococcus phage [Actinomycetota bacterium]|jgi:hypothetical protein
MAVTQNTYTGNGSITNYSFTFPYLETTDIKVSVNGVDTTAYTLANATTVSFNTAPANGAAIRIYRDTDDAALAATFYPGSAIRAKDLNDNFTQNLYVTQEINNNAVSIDGSNPMVSDFNMNGYKITNLAAPVASTDAANRSFVEGVFSSEVPVFYRRWSKTAVGGETSLSGNDDNGITLSYVPGSEKVFINGALQVRGIDYLGTTGSTLTGIPALIAGDIVEVHSSSSYTVGTVPDGSVTNAKVDSGAAIQSTKLAFTQSGIGATTRTVESKLKDVVSVKDFGAVGDGVADDTAAIQAAIDAHKCVFFPEGIYLVSTITPGDEAHLIGAGKYRSEIVGKIVCGDGGGSIREIELSHLSVNSTGSPYAVTFNLCPDFRVFDCEIKGGINILFSVRGVILNSDVTTSGSGNWAIRASDYTNGLVIRDCVITGGSAGGAINIRGPLTVGTITGNVIESSYDGIWVANESIVSGTDAGACTNVQITNNYIEECRTPIRLGEIFKCTNFTVSGNYVGNSNTSNVSARTSAFWFRRFVNSTFTENKVALLNAVENFIEWSIDAVGDFYGNVFSNNLYDNTPANVFYLTGSGAATTSLLRKLGGSNFFDFLKSVSVSGVAVPGLSSLQTRQWISPTFTANVSVAQTAWLLGSETELGGYISKVELIDVVGTLTTCRLRIGDTSQNNRVLDIADLSSVSLTNGAANLSATGSVFSGSTHNTYLITAGTGTGTFRIRITYKAT